MSIIRIDHKAISEAMEALSHIDGAFEPILSASMNKALTSARTTAVREVKKRYTVEDDGIRNKIKLVRSTPESLEARFTNAGRVIPLDKFAISPGKPDPRRRTPIAAEVVFGQPRVIDDSFVAEMQNTKVGVFRRVGRSRLPIKMFYGPSLAQMLGSERVVNAVEKTANRVMARELDKRVGETIDELSGVKR